MKHVPFQPRILDPADFGEARQLAGDCGVTGIYLLNHLARTHEVDLLGLYGKDDLLGVLHSGGRGNLLVLLRQPLDGERVAGAIRERLWNWRIVLGPEEVVTALVATEPIKPLAHRRQVFYVANHSPEAPSPAAEPLDMELRPAAPEDARLLVQATLELNQEDLGVPGWRISKDWVKRNVRQRQKEGTTWVIGPVGRPYAKVDVGSQGPAGVVLEGVYTWRNFRGQGHATRMVKACLAQCRDAPCIGLHVAAANTAARRAYERAGMVEAGECVLMLRG